jgi:hypothetical protein
MIIQNIGYSLSKNQNSEITDLQLITKEEQDPLKRQPKSMNK